ncbi:MAG: hypothetical protein JSV51_06425 [Candidatus Bathyarchaeota archaeon]|nr:MAG: hypothetical protein JSV51_06425 [Candidatus Bathyarchaeota archaeon]
MASHDISKAKSSGGRSRLSQVKMKIRVNVFINNISAERFWEIKRPLPPVKIATNLNLISVTKSSDNSLEVPFVFTISYNPAVAQISVRGKAHVSGEEEELKKIHTSYGEKKAPPPVIVQTISNIVFLESVFISRTLQIPPPIPLPKVPLVDGRKKKSEPSYRA